MLNYPAWASNGYFFQALQSLTAYNIFISVFGAAGRASEIKLQWVLSTPAERHHGGRVPGVFVSGRSGKLYLGRSLPPTGRISVKFAQ